MRFVRSDVRDHVASQKNDHGPSYRCYGASQRRSCPKIIICEIFRVVRFSTFSTVSALFGHGLAWWMRSVLGGKPTAPASPWQNGFAERLIGSIRRECLDHIVVFGETHLRRILQPYAQYYNGVRTHRSLDKDAPAVRPVQRTGSIKSFPILGGLHRHYVRI